VTAAELAARCLELLGAPDGPIAIEPPTGPLATALERCVRVDARAPVAAVCAFLGERADSAARGARLDALAARLVPGAPLALVDHNQPRAWWRRPLAWVALARHGLAPSRARHPVAREADAHGFRVERMRLVAGERLQLVLARRR